MGNLGLIRTNHGHLHKVSIHDDQVIKCAKKHGNGPKGTREY